MWCVLWYRIVKNNAFDIVWWVMHFINVMLQRFLGLENRTWTVRFLMEEVWFAIFPNNAINSLPSSVCCFFAPIAATILLPPPPLSCIRQFTWVMVWARAGRKNCNFCTHSAVQSRCLLFLRVYKKYIYLKFVFHVLSRQFNAHQHQTSHSKPNAMRVRTIRVLIVVRILLLRSESGSDRVDNF